MYPPGDISCTCAHTHPSCLHKPLTYYTHYSEQVTDLYMAPSSSKHMLQARWCAKPGMKFAG